jgi:hypothetical protein
MSVVPLFQPDQQITKKKGAPSTKKGPLLPCQQQTNRPSPPAPQIDLDLIDLP